MLGSQIAIVVEERRWQRPLLAAHINPAPASTTNNLEEESMNASTSTSVFFAHNASTNGLVLQQHPSQGIMLSRRSFSFTVWLWLEIAWQQRLGWKANSRSLESVTRSNRDPLENSDAHNPPSRVQTQRPPSNQTWEHFPIGDTSGPEDLSIKAKTRVALFTQDVALWPLCADALHGSYSRCC